MSTSASSLNWWYIDGSFLRISSGDRREAMSRNTPPCGLPRPALTSELIARATSSRGSSSGGRRLLSGSVYQRSPSASLVAYCVAEHVRDVVEHEPLALGVAQHPAVAADGLGDEDPLHRRRPDHARRVELQELHVDQRRARTQGQGVPVAGVLPGVAGHLVALADPARGQHDRRRVEADEAPVAAEVAEAAGDLPVRHQQLRDRALVEDPDVRLVVAGGLVVLLLQRDDLLLQGADQLQAGAVTDVRQPRVGVAAEVALADLAVLGAVEQRTVGLELPDPVRRLPGVQLGHPPVVEELPAAHGVAVVDLPVVVGIDVPHRRGAATLGHHRVGLAEQRLRDDRRALALHAGLDRGAQPRPARTDHDHVVVVPLDRFTVDVLGHARHPTIRRSEIHPAETAMM